MLQRRDGPDLPDEAFGADHRGQLGPQHLDRHLAAVLQVFGQIHGRHAAFAQLPLDGVAVTQGRLEHVEGHGASPLLGALSAPTWSDTTRLASLIIVCCPAVNESTVARKRESCNAAPA